MQKSKNFINVNQLRKIYNIYVILILICFLTCCYQIVDRIMFYLTYPFAINIFLNFHGILDSFEIKIILVGNNLGYQKIKENKMSIIGQDCLIMYKKLLSINNTVDIKYWLLPNKSSVIEKINTLNTLTFNTTHDEFEIINEITVMGYSATVELGKHVEKGILIHLIAQPAYQNCFIMFFNEFSDVNGYEYFTHKTANDYIFLFKKHINTNSPANPCVSSKSFKNCYKNCILHQINRKAKCRLPSHDKKITLPTCTEKNAVLSYLTTFKLHFHPDVYKNCKCVRPCVRLPFQIFKKTKKISKIALFTIEKLKIITEIKESLIYDKSSLLSNIAGNLGLIMGLSILSTFEIMFSILIKLKKIWKRNFSLEEIANSLYFKNLKIDLNFKSLSFKNFKIILWIMCVTILLFMVQDRFRYFLQHPVRNIIKIEFSSNVTLPSVTICPLSGIRIFMKKKFAKQNNVSDWCDISFINLINTVNKNKLEKLWKLLHNPVISSSYLLKDIIGSKMLRSKITAIKTHRGTCNHFKFDSTKHFGSLTQFSVVYMYDNQQYCKKKSNDPIKVSIFFDHPGSITYNILSESRVIAFGVIAFEFRFKIIKRLNINSRPCLNNEDYYKCKKSCLLDKIYKYKICRIPIIDNVSNLFECSTTEEIKNSLKNYIKIITKIESNNYCMCTRLCKETILLRSSYITDVGKGYEFFLAASFVAQDSVYENIHEVENYDLTSLFSDIGNNVQIALGTSILTIINFIYNLFLRAKISHFRVKK